MSAGIVRGRHGDTHAGGLVLFLIGIRLNRLRAVRAWWPVFTAMPRMLTELAADPVLGLLGTRNVIGGVRDFQLIQYWRDIDSLIGYAQSRDHAHRPAWSAFNRAVEASDGAVGIWHETFIIPVGGHETIYSDMPPFGLGKLGLTPATGSRADARGRLRGVQAGSGTAGSVAAIHPPPTTRDPA